MPARKTQAGTEAIGKSLDIDVGARFKDEEGVTLHEGDRLSLARRVLAWIAVISVGIIAAHIAYPDNKAGAEAFELVKIGALPLVTLVISFYFPKTGSR